MNLSAGSVRIPDTTPPPRLINSTDLILSACVSGVISAVCCILQPGTMLHWFMIPVYISGVMIGLDCLAWLGGRLDLFDPVGWVGAYGYYFFFIAPLLTVLWGYHTAELGDAPHWRDWIGWMAVLNSCGIAVYRFGRRFLNRPRAWNTVMLFDYRRLTHVMCLILPLTFGMQVIVFIKFGGIWGFMETFAARDGAFEGMGWQFLIAESFPMLLVIFILVRKRQILTRASWTTIAFLIAALFIIKMFFGGLRGSRSNTIWPMFWLLGAIHLWIRPVPRRFLIAGIPLLMIFMYLYGFYKTGGTDAVQTVQSFDDMQSTSDTSGRTLEAALLGDLARSDIQAYELYRLTEVGGYNYAGGATYLSALAVVVPKSIRPGWIPSKVEKGTEALHGNNSYSLDFRASQVYGLAGEAMLNFTPLSVPLVFVALAWVVVTIRRMLSLHPDDVRRLYLPLLVLGCIVVLSSDLDNVVVFLLTTVLPISLVLKLSTRCVQL